MPRSLKPCPSSPNCVSTLASIRDSGAAKRMPPIGFTLPPAEAMATLRDAVRAAGGRIVESDDTYLHAELTSRWFRFVDDVELLMDTNARRVDFRSASRVGYWDLGANRRRMRRLARYLERTGNFFCIEHNP